MHPGSIVVYEYYYLNNSYSNSNLIGGDIVARSTSASVSRSMIKGWADRSGVCPCGKAVAGIVTRLDKMAPDL